MVFHSKQWHITVHAHSINKRTVQYFRYCTQKKKLYENKICFRSELSSWMEAVRTSETLVDNYFTRQYIPEDNSEHHTRRRENLKSHKICFVLESQMRTWILMNGGTNYFRQQAVNCLKLKEENFIQALIPWYILRSLIYYSLSYRAKYYKDCTLMSWITSKPCKLLQSSVQCLQY
jgi:hypothetical protein